MSEKFPTMEQEAFPKMLAILERYGLQITLKILIDSLEELIRKRGKDHLNLMVVEGLRGLHKGYLRRNEPDDEIPDHYDFDMER